MWPECLHNCFDVNCQTSRALLLSSGDFAVRQHPVGSVCPWDNFLLNSQLWHRSRRRVVSVSAFVSDSVKEEEVARVKLLAVPSIVVWLSIFSMRIVAGRKGEAVFVIFIQIELQGAFWPPPREYYFFINSNNSMKGAEAAQRAEIKIRKADGFVFKLQQLRKSGLVLQNFLIRKECTVNSTFFNFWSWLHLYGKLGRRTNKATFKLCHSAWRWWNVSRISASVM